MDHIVNRETEAMRCFAADADRTARELERVVLRFRGEVAAAEFHMRDDSGRRATRLLWELVDTSWNLTQRVRDLAHQVKDSAALLEESDRLP